MLGLSNGEVVFMVQATAALIGPKDASIIALTAGIWSESAVGYVQSVRG